MDNVKANWSIELNCECPECEHYFDILSDTEDFWDGRRGLEIGEHGTNQSKDLGIYCPKCRHEFVVDLEY